MTGPRSPSRRQFLRNAGVLAGTALLSPWLRAAAQTPMATASLTLNAARKGLLVSPQLAGLSYETLQLHDPAFFSPDNNALIALLRTLNPDGVLRIGGNTSDFAVWSEYRGALPNFPQVPHAIYRRPYVVTPEQLTNLAGFLRATGWRLIFGVNLKSDLPEMAAELAAAVQRAVGDQLLAIQIGNEPNGYPTKSGKAIEFNEYFSRWQRTAKAIRQKVSVPFAGPDTGANTDWVMDFAKRAQHLGALTRHYYRNGASAPSATIPDLLSGDAGFLRDVAQIHQLAQSQDLPFILSEVNSYWSGGKLGVSNTFASALWGGDFMLAGAKSGIHSFNFHGGVLSVLEASLGKRAVTTAPGTSRLDRIDAVSGRYTPIAGDVHTGFYARPLYYGMLLAQQFSGARFIESQLASGGANLTAYAAERNGKRMLVVFNKDLARDATIQVRLDAPATRATIGRLAAPAITDVHHTRFAGNQIGPDGSWNAKTRETVPIKNGQFALALPRTSAVLLRLES